MALGIDKTKSLMLALTDFACDLIDLIRKGVSLDSVNKIVQVYLDAKKACQAAKGISEEMKDLDKGESAELGMLALQCFQRILTALVK